MQEIGLGQGCKTVGEIRPTPIVQSLLNAIEDELANMDDKISALHGNLEYVSLPKPSNKVEEKLQTMSPIMADRLNRILYNLRMCKYRIVQITEELEI